MISTALRTQMAVFIQKISKRNGLISIPWDIVAKACIFAMDTQGHWANLLHLFPLTQKLRGATLGELEEGRTAQFRSRENFDANGIIWFFHTLRNLVNFMPCVFLTFIEIEDCNRIFMEFLLELNYLRALYNIVEALKYKFTMRYCAVYSWAALTKAADNSNPERHLRGPPFDREDH